MIRWFQASAIACFMLVVCSIVAAQEAEPPSVFADGVPGDQAQTAPVPAQASFAAKEEYLKRFVWFEDWVAINAQTGGFMGSWSVPYKGKYKEQLRGSHYYEYVGRPDLAATYRKRNGIRWGVFGGGTVLEIVGLSVMLAGVAYDGGCLDVPDEEYDACTADEEDVMKRKLVIGGVLAGTGLVATMVALFIKPHPVTPSESRALADEFNRKLRIELGIPLDAEITAADRSIYNTKGVAAQLTTSLGVDNGLVFNMTF